MLFGWEVFWFLIFFVNDFDIWSYEEIYFLGVMVVFVVYRVNLRKIWGFYRSGFVFFFILCNEVFFSEVLFGGRFFVFELG